MKIFVVGMNKSGTTSVMRALLDFGYKTGNQHIAERLIRDYAKRDFSSLFKYCEKGHCFKDVPFSLPYTFAALDGFFPGSKFILTVRDNSEQWFNSLVNFHMKVYGSLSRATLKGATYNYPGYAWEAAVIGFNFLDGDSNESPYVKKDLICLYETHNQNVKDHFKERPNDLLVVNVADPTSYLSLCRFLNKQPLYQKMPWENRTQARPNFALRKRIKMKMMKMKNLRKFHC